MTALRLSGEKDVRRGRARGEGGTGCERDVLGFLDGLLISVAGYSEHLVIIFLLRLLEQLLCPLQL